ncbi:MAG: METTL5 family protein [Halobacteriota archaeon]
MKLRDLEIALERLEGFDEPRVDLEQYETPAALAARVVHHADLQGELDRVVDLGCGPGVFSVAAALRGARVLAVDVDPDALDVMRSNLAMTDVEDAVEVVRADVRRSPLLPMEDATVLMNPPFGAQDRGADRAFLDVAADVADVAYSVHNEGSQDFLETYVDGRVTRSFSAEIEIPRTYDFHVDDVRKQNVEVVRLEFD